MSILISLNALGTGARVNNEWSDEPVHLNSLARVFAAHIHNVKLHMRFCLVICLYE